MCCALLRFDWYLRCRLSSLEFAGPCAVLIWALVDSTIRPAVSKSICHSSHCQCHNTGSANREVPHYKLFSLLLSLVPSRSKYSPPPSPLYCYRSCPNECEVTTHVPVRCPKQPALQSPHQILTFYVSTLMERPAFCNCKQPHCTGRDKLKFGKAFYCRDSLGQPAAANVLTL
jgi:hypothetical protein